MIIIMAVFHELGVVMQSHFDWEKVEMVEIYIRICRKNQVTISGFCDLTLSLSLFLVPCLKCRFLFFIKNNKLMALVKVLHLCVPVRNIKLFIDSVSFSVNV